MIKTTINQVNFVRNNGIYFNNQKLNNNNVINFYEKNKKQKYRVVDLLNTSIIENDIINKSQLIDYLNLIIKNGKLYTFLVEKIENAKVRDYIDYISIDRLERLQYLITTENDNDKILAIYLLVNNYFTDIFLRLNKI